jgi:predicted dehydrogenase
MTAPVRIAVAGAGLIGQRHIEEVDATADAQLASIVDPRPAAAVVAEEFGVPLYRSLAELFETDRPDGVILATPNQLHVDGRAGVPRGRGASDRGEAHRRHRRGRHPAGRGS